MSQKFVMVATWSMALEGVKSQYNDVRMGTKTINQAIVDAVCQVEDNPAFKSVGYGGLPNINGVVKLDASFMEGDTLKVGALASLEGYANPIKIAYKLKDNQFNSMLVGIGAEQYAEKNNFESKEMLTEDSKIRYEARKVEVENSNLSPYSGHDTVCMVGMDTNGSISTGTSTSGLFMKEEGRVGDSPISGSGFYANSSYGACAATGLGEDIMKTCISYSVVSLIKAGYNAQDACDIALAEAQEELLSKYKKPGDISIVACDIEGNIGAATTIEEFSYVAFNHQYEPKIYLVNNNGDHTVASDEWIKQYFAKEAE